MTATADLFDERGEDLLSLALPLRHYGSVLTFSGPVRTVKCFEDNALVKAEVSTPGDGAVLVVDGAGSLRRALLGDMIAQIAADNGWAGVIINGAVRDVAVLRTIPIGIMALASNPRKSAKNAHGVVGEPIEFGGITFRPGRMLWADEDGVLTER